MLQDFPPQLIALGAALSYATSGIAARRGMRYSTPITVTLVSLTIHAVSLWSVVFLTGGIPLVSSLALLLFFITGTLQPVIRWFTYTGIFYMGASRGTTIRGSHPMFSTLIAIMLLGERAEPAVIAGTCLIVGGVALISWRPATAGVPFKWWHVGIPLGAAVLAGISHPIRRYAMSLANEPLYFAAVVGLVSLCWMAGYLLSPFGTDRPKWHPQALWPFLIAGSFETLGILLVMLALSVGQVVLVSPIIATSPLWILLGSWLFLRGIEPVTLRTIVGAFCVVSGTIAISMVR